MKKTILIISVVLVALAVSVCLTLIEKRPASEVVIPRSVDSIESSHGFSLTVPPDWELWEGISSISTAYAANLPLLSSSPPIFESTSLQMYLNAWRPNESTDLVFIRRGSSLIATTRNVSAVLAYEKDFLRSPHHFDTVTVRVNDVPYRVYQVEKHNEFVDTEEGLFLDKPAVYSRTKSHDTHDVISIIFPLDSERTIGVHRTIGKGDAIPHDFLEEFMRTFSNNITS